MKPFKFFGIQFGGKKPEQREERRYIPADQVAEVLILLDAYRNENAKGSANVERYELWSCLEKIFPDMPDCNVTLNTVTATKPYVSWTVG